MNSNTMVENSVYGLINPLHFNIKSYILIIKAKENYQDNCISEISFEYLSRYNISQIPHNDAPQNSKTSSQNYSIDKQAKIIIIFIISFNYSILLGCTCGVHKHTYDFVSLAYKHNHICQ